MTQLKGNNLTVGVTGVTGTIGHAFCRDIIKNRPDVRINAYHSTASAPGSDRRRRLDIVQRELKGGNINWVDYRDNYLELDALKQLVGGSDIVVHFAGWVDHKVPADRVRYVLEANVVWPAILSALAWECRAARFLFASTRMVYTLTAAAIPANGISEGFTAQVKPEYVNYGDKFIQAVEQYACLYAKGQAKATPAEFIAGFMKKNNLAEQWGKELYGLSKFWGEKLMAGLWEAGLTGISLRFAPVFGPSPVDSQTRAVPMLIGMVRSDKEEITVMPWENGFLYLKDLVPALVAALDADISRPEAVVHFGPHLKRYSQQAVVECLLAIANKKIRIRTLTNFPERKDELLDVGRARRLFGLKETSLEKALEETYRFFAAPPR
jgi:nucleoside-diphosphate-sugar epimerase